MLDLIFDLIAILVYGFLCATSPKTKESPIMHQPISEPDPDYLEKCFRVEHCTSCRGLISSDDPAHTWVENLNPGAQITNEIWADVAARSMSRMPPPEGFAFSYYHPNCYKNRADQIDFTHFAKGNPHE